MSILLIRTHSSTDSLALRGTVIFVIGFPADPLTKSPLFGEDLTSGVQRISVGHIRPPLSWCPPGAHSGIHDATTAPGSAGSPLLVLTGDGLKVRFFHAEFHSIVSDLGATFRSLAFTLRNWDPSKRCSGHRAASRTFSSEKGCWNTMRQSMRRK